MEWTGLVRAQPRRGVRRQQSSPIGTINPLLQQNTSLFYKIVRYFCNICIGMYSSWGIFGTCKQFFLFSFSQIGITHQGLIILAYFYLLKTPRSEFEKRDEDEFFNELRDVLNSTTFRVSDTCFLNETVLGEKSKWNLANLWKLVLRF